MKSPKRSVAGAIRWWTPLLWLAVGTAGLVFAAWAGGVDMHAVGERIADRLDETFNHSSTEIRDERGTLRVEFDRQDKIRRVLHDGKVLPPEDFVLDDKNYLTVNSLKYDDGELMYWHIPLNWNDEVREQVRNPRWRMQMRVHPRPEGEPPGLRVARVGAKDAAARAGVRVGDVIVGVEDQRPATSAELEAALQAAITERAPGGVLALLIERGGAEQLVRVELEPLLSKEEWDALPEQDLEERWMFYAQPWRREHRERDRRAAAAAAAAQQPAAEPAAPDVPVPTAPPPPPPDSPK
ncbi:MAG TPA: PDZ domain-containing protein [Planctomycetota bacterium]|nr:PDZ domain-containing protein [Planctomycetota bacterium]